MRVRILFIDDEPHFNESHAEALRDADFEVVCEASAANALKRLNSNDNFDLIILDLLMPPNGEDIQNGTSDPRETGVKVHRQIRSSGNIDVPIIFLSVIRDPRITDRVKELEIRYGHTPKILRKPILPSEVVASVRTALNKS